MRVLLCPLVTCISVCIFPAEARKGSITDRCSNHPEPGDCTSRLKWYFDTSLKRCEPFMYGDCPGNMEFFASFKECTDTCKSRPKEPASTGKYKGHKHSLQPDTSSRRQRQQTNGETNQRKEGSTSRHPPVRGTCFTRPRKGRCNDNSEKWWYNGGFWTCQPVKKGHCPNHGTFFNSCEECMQKCRRTMAHICKHRT
ncbi:doenitin-1-like [Dermacentor andersoni]|uniref:doenitin-1-like n=1 Tax=Dermacentor andersoni TaxID=34620 RepID=UPI003B3B3579